MQAISKDPSQLTGPEGMTRHFLDTTDRSDLTFNGTNWVDISGNPVNMSSKSTVKVIDVPRDTLNEKVAIPGKDFNAAFGDKVVDPDKTVMVSPNEMAAANTQRLKNDREESLGKLSERQAQLAIKNTELAIKKAEKELELGNKAEAQIAIDSTKAMLSGVQDQLRAATAVFDQEAIKQYADEAGRLNQRLENLMDEMAGKKPKEPTKPDKAGQILDDPDIVREYIRQYGSPSKAMEAAKKDGWQIPEETAAPATPAKPNTPGTGPRDFVSGVLESTPIGGLVQGVRGLVKK
jgi:hypothetical protein